MPWWTGRPVGCPEAAHHHLPAAGSVGRTRPTTPRLPAPTTRRRGAVAPGSRRRGWRRRRAGPRASRSRARSRRSRGTGRGSPATRAQRSAPPPAAPGRSHQGGPTTARPPATWWLRATPRARYRPARHAQRPHLGCARRAGSPGWHRCAPGSSSAPRAPASRRRALRPAPRAHARQQAHARQRHDGLVRDRPPPRRTARPGREHRRPVCPCDRRPTSSARRPAPGARPSRWRHPPAPATGRAAPSCPAHGRPDPRPDRASEPRGWKPGSARRSTPAAWHRPR